MIYKRAQEVPRRRRPQNDRLYCEDAQVKAIRELVGGLSEIELYAAAQKLREMGVIA